MKKNNFIIALILILGTVLTLTVGLNVSLDYSAHTMVEVPLQKEFLISDIKAITKEVFPQGKIEIQKASEIVSKELKELIDTAGKIKKEGIKIWNDKVFKKLSERLGGAYNEKVEEKLQLSKSPYLMKLF